MAVCHSLAAIYHDGVRGLRRILPSWWDNQSPLTVIDIGIDESKSGSILVMSAIVGNTGLMRKLDTEWKRELIASGVDYFHANEHWNGNSKPYNGISRNERDALLSRLIRHFHSRFMFAPSVVTPVPFRTTSEIAREDWSRFAGLGTDDQQLDVGGAEPLSTKQSTSRWPVPDSEVNMVRRTDSPSKL
jgi:hypothetical protein